MDSGPSPFVISVVRVYVYKLEVCVYLLLFPSFLHSNGSLDLSQKHCLVVILCFKECSSLTSLSLISPCGVTRIQMVPSDPHILLKILYCSRVGRHYDILLLELGFKGNTASVFVPPLFSLSFYWITYSAISQWLCHNGIIWRDPRGKELRFLVNYHVESGYSSPNQTFR